MVGQVTVTRVPPESEPRWAFSTCLTHVKEFCQTVGISSLLYSQLKCWAITPVNGSGKQKPPSIYVILHNIIQYKESLVISQELSALNSSSTSEVHYIPQFRLVAIVPFQFSF